MQQSGNGGVRLDLVSDTPVEPGVRVRDVNTAQQQITDIQKTDNKAVAWLKYPAEALLNGRHKIWK